jgi:predicted dehydrogenase
MRWGIAATGAIAAGFATGLAETEGAERAAVASRTTERAQAFADEHGFARAHGSYEALAEDPEVDVVYVASPQNRHCDDTLLFLEAGKHVLCEKPFAMNRAEGERMVAAARDRGLFLMEAMWSRFLPAYVTLRELLAEGRIGEVNLVEADFGFALPVDPTHRLFDPALGGGALLDLGVYPVQLARLALGPPDRVGASGHIGSTGVDEAVAAVLHHPGGTLAVVKAAITMRMTCTARLAGTEGSIELPAMMHCPNSLSVVSPFGERDELVRPIEGQGLRYQVDEVHACIADGRLESDVMPQAETLGILETLDAIRHQIG